jgi:hypothetical protein
MSLVKVQNRTSQVISWVLVGAGLSAGVALAAGLIDPATKADGIAYVDSDYLGAGATVQAVDLGSAGSGSEKTFEIQVTLPTGAGSLSEDARFVGSVTDGATLPSDVSLRPADARFKATSPNAAGVLGIDQFDRTKLKGELLGYDIEALPRRSN